MKKAKAVTEDVRQRRAAIETAFSQPYPHLVDHELTCLALANGLMPEEERPGALAAVVACCAIPQDHLRYWAVRCAAYDGAQAGCFELTVAKTGLLRIDRFAYWEIDDFDPYDSAWINRLRATKKIGAALVRTAREAKAGRSLPIGRGPAEVEHFLAPEWFPRWRALPPKLRRTLRRRFRLWQASPRHGAFNERSVRTAKGRMVYLEPGYGYRVAGLEGEGRIDWFFVGTTERFIEEMSNS